MKPVLLLLLLTFNFSFAQNSVEKWNPYQKRYETFDNSGNMISYKVYNTYKNQWETYNVQSNNYQPQPVVNTELVQKTLTTLQAKYDANYNTIEAFISKCYNSLQYSDMDKVLIENIKNSFNSNYVLLYRKKGYDLSSNKLTNQVIEWLHTGFLETIESEKTKYSQKVKSSKDEVLAFMNYHGGYKVPLLYEYELKNDKYVLIKKETYGNYLYYSGDYLYFKRSSNSTWFNLDLTFNIYNPYLKTYSFNTSYNATVYIDEVFKIVTIVQDNKKYEYVIGDYDKTIIPQ